MRRWPVVVVVGLLILAVAWCLGSPLLLNGVADDPFPLAANRFHAIFSLATLMKPGA